MVGGLQTVVHNLAQELIARGHDVRVVTNRYPKGLPTKETLDGVDVDRLMLLSPNAGYLRRGRPDLFAAALFYGPQSYARLRKIMSAFRPDVVNVHFPDHQIPFVLKLRDDFSFRLVVSLHGHDVERTNLASIGDGAARQTANPRPNSRKKKLGSVLKRADAVTACSSNILDKATEIEPSVRSKGHVIYNGVDLSRFVNKARHAHPRRYILAIGRLTHNKGFDVLLQAFAEARGTDATIDLIIAGEGEQREHLQSLLNELRLDQQVSFFGTASPEKVVELLNGALFVVVPSRHEAFGIVALEALAAGKHVLATRTGGLGEFLANISEKSVTLVQPGRQELAQALKKQLAANGNGSGIAPDTSALLDQYSWANVARRYESALMGSSQS